MTPLPPGVAYVEVRLQLPRCPPVEVVKRIPLGDLIGVGRPAVEHACTQAVTAALHEVDQEALLQRATGLA
jgi:hypothetical protein